MKKMAVLAAAGVLTLMMGTSVFASSSAAGSARGYATDGLMAHHAEYFGGYYNHVGMPGCPFSNQSCWTTAGYSVGDRVTEPPAPTGGQQAASGQTYSQGSTGGYVSTGSYSYGSGNQGYGGNYTDANSNGVCDNWEDGSCYGNGYGGGYGNGHHGGGHGRGCRW